MRVTIIVPVYGDWPSLKKCIESLKQYVASQHNILLVNDCGPEVELMEKNIKLAIKGSKNFKYYRNGENLGFVRTCNRAVSELDTTDNDILLLNSDTKVTESFLEQMLDVLYAQESHGVVSPRSNNATITTVPLSAAKQKGIDPDKSFKLFQKLKTKLPSYNEIPVAHGFCMLIRRSLIQKYGLFDEVFGKGYGEEVDFCMRIKKHGFISVLSNRAYVFHLEAKSFTHETKAKLLAVNNQIIWKRYPGYRQLVSDYMNEALYREEGINPGSTPGDSSSRIKRLVRRNGTVLNVTRKLRSKFGK